MCAHVLTAMADAPDAQLMALLCQLNTPLVCKKKHHPALDSHVPRGEYHSPVGMESGRMNASTVKSPVPSAQSADAGAVMYDALPKVMLEVPNLYCAVLITGVPVFDQFAARFVS